MNATRQIFSQSLGTEELLDTVEATLQRDINDTLAAIYVRKAVADEARAARRGVTYAPLTVHEIPIENYHTGNFPSLALEEVPYEEYPYIVMTIEDYAPDAEDSRQDHLDVFRQSLAVHTLAYATEEEGAEVVFRRAVRMSEAVYWTFVNDPVMHRFLSGLSNPTRGQHSIPWTNQKKGRGANYWYQAVGTSYAIKTYTTQYDLG